MPKTLLITAPVGNNPARVRFLVYFKGLEESISMASPADYGGLASPEYRAINPMGKLPALILPSGEYLYEAKVIMGYLLDVYASVGPQVGAATPEARARAALITQVHDLYIASPNATDVQPTVTATQGCMYKPIDVIDGPTRAGKLAEIWKQLGVLEGLIVGPYAAGTRLVTQPAGRCSRVLPLELRVRRHLLHNRHEPPALLPSLERAPDLVLDALRGR